MEDEDIAPSTVHTADLVGMGRKSRQYTLFQYRVQAHLSAHTDWTSCTDVFDTIPLSSILGTHLYTTLSSMAHNFKLV